MKIISLVEYTNLPISLDFKAFALNIDNPKKINKEISFVKNILKDMQFYTYSQLMLFVLHRNAYESLNLINFDFTNAFNRLKLGAISYNKFINNIDEDKTIEKMAKNFKLRQILSKHHINDTLFYLWFVLDSANYKYDDKTFFACLMNLVNPINLFKTRAFEKLVNLNLPLKLQWSTASKEFKSVFLLKLSDQFNIKLSGEKIN